MWRDTLIRLFPALRSLGHGCYVVGGAVRDLHLHREPGDVDVACRDPLAVAQSIGGELITVVRRRHVYYRVNLAERSYDFAEFVGGDIEHDLEWRDFTIDAMAVDLSGDVLLDPFEGRRDLETRLLRMVKESNYDVMPLHFLRGVRLAVKYDFAFEPATLDAIRRRASLIRHADPELVTKELGLIFSYGRRRKALDVLHATGLDQPLGLTHP